MTLNMLDYITSILDSQNIQCTFLKAPYDNLSNIDYNLRHKLGLTIEYISIHEWIMTHCASNTLYILRDSFLLSYIVFKLPNEFFEVGEYAVLGPLFFQPLTKETFATLSQKYQWSSNVQNQFLSFYEEITIFPSEDRFIALIIPLLKGILGKDIYLQHFELTPKETKMDIVDIVDLCTDMDPNLSFIQKRYDIENQLLDAVKHGNYAKATLYHKKFIQYNIKPRVTNLLRNEQNMLIIFNSLLRKAVEDVHVHPYHIDLLSRKFAIKIEGCTNTEQLASLTNEMLHKYCILVQNHSLVNYSSPIQNCITYIEFNYTENLTLDIIAHALNLSNAYLSNLFKKEVGITITDFIHKTQLRHAIKLLNTTQLPIHDIAIQCGFDDINYFSRVFKKYQGQTPSTYRKIIHQAHH